MRRAHGVGCMGGSEGVGDRREWGIGGSGG